MIDAPRCAVCGQPLLRDDELASGGRDPVHARCDRRSADRQRPPVSCSVCGRVITSKDGVARLGDVLVHGTCYVKARTAATGDRAPAIPPAPAPARKRAGLFGKKDAPRA